MSSLFDRPGTWISNPSKAFDAFVVSPEFLNLSRRKPVRKNIDEVSMPPAPLRSSSVTVYRSMFGKYLRFLVKNRIDFFDVSSADLLAFLDNTKGLDGDLKPVLKSRIKYKYLRLIERIYTHLHVNPNPARHACFDIFQRGDHDKGGRDEAMAVLTEEQQNTFLAALPQTLTGNWKTIRDRAMQAMMIGSGLKVSETLGLRVENVSETESINGSITITVSPGVDSGISRWHQTPLRAFAVPEVQSWLRERRERKIVGPLLFPASINGGRLNPSTIYRQVKATFVRAGIAVPRLGGRTLRNTFAVRELRGGAGIELIGEFMGHRKRRSIEEYCNAAVSLKSQKAAEFD